MECVGASFQFLLTYLVLVDFNCISGGLDTNLRNPIEDMEESLKILYPKERQINSDDECYREGERVWHCKKDTECPGLKEILNNGKTPKTCFWEDNNTHIICCPPIVDLAQPKISISQRKCEEYRNLTCNWNLSRKHEFYSLGVTYYTKFDENVQPPGSRYKAYFRPKPIGGGGGVGGREAYPGEVPSTTMIGYGEESSINWQCGGSLISERYVLSAAHCSDTSYGPARWARLGDLDISKDDEDSWPQQFQIVQRIVHSGYKDPAYYNDIVLFKLDQHVIFDYYVRPACLNQDLGETQGRGFATGWGKTEASGPKSKVLIRVDLEFIPTAECKNTIGTVRTYLPTGLDSQTMMCAGERGKDTCQGDSGGPLMLPRPDPYPLVWHCINTQVGVTSFGAKYCGLFPGTSGYVRVAHFLPWIESVVWPDD